MTADNNADSFVHHATGLAHDVLAKLTKSTSDEEFNSHKAILGQILTDIQRHGTSATSSEEEKPHVQGVCCSTCLPTYEACLQVHSSSYCQQQYLTCMNTCVTGC